VRSRTQGLLRVPKTIGKIGKAWGELGAGARTPAPRCSLNRPIGTRRALGTARTDLAAVHAAAHSCGATVNDAVLAAVTGALQKVLAERGEHVDHLVVSVPVSSRRQTTVAQLGNRVGVIPVSLPVGADLAERMGETASIMRGRKSRTPGSSTALLAPAFRLLAGIGLFAWFINRQHMVNTFVSNLHGPPSRLQFLGAPVIEIIPVSMTSGNITVAFTALSYAGRLNITVVADPDHCADYPRIAQVLQEELDHLTAGVSGPAAPDF
jgi:diacylglycerol O-acyltransferase